MIKKIARRILPDRLLIHLLAIDHYLSGERELRLLRHLCDKDRLSVDIGANIGTYTYFIRRYSRHVYAFEPNPGLARRLGALFPDVTVRQAAATDSPGNLRLRVPIVDGRPQHELASVAASFEDAAQVDEYDVPAVRIDDENLSNVGFIKVDAEQHEIQVLKGALETIRVSRPVIMTEVTPLLYPHPLPEMLRFITEMDYEGWFRFDGAYLRFSQFEEEIHANKAQFGIRFMHNNVIFLPREADASCLSRG
jgi:FkbM family methyltransferase